MSCFLAHWQPGMAESGSGDELAGVQAARPIYTLSGFSSRVTTSIAHMAVAQEKGINEQDLEVTEFSDCSEDPRQTPSKLIAL
eukprot:1779946-Amphidinium_carterae.1